MATVSPDARQGSTPCSTRPASTLVEAECRRFSAAVMGRPRLAPGRYFRQLLVRSFEGLRSERGIAWRAAYSLAIRRFLHLGLEDTTPDHSTIADKGYHSTRTLIDWDALAVHAYIAEPNGGRRQWRDLPEAQALGYANRRRLRGARGGRLQRRRAEYVERSFAHLYETRAMRRTHLRGHQNILKRLLVHAGAFNSG